MLLFKERVTYCIFMFILGSPDFLLTVTVLYCTVPVKQSLVRESPIEMTVLKIHSPPQLHFNKSRWVFLFFFCIKFSWIASACAMMEG